MPENPPEQTPSRVLRDARELFNQYLQDPTPEMAKRFVDACAARLIIFLAEMTWAAAVRAGGGEREPPLPSRPPVYDRNYGDDRLCVCGHPYYRHFDTYEDMENVGCKYCDCGDFRPAA